VIFRGFIRAGHEAIWLAVRMILSAWFDHLEESFSSYKQSSVQKILPAFENHLSSCWKHQWNLWVLWLWEPLLLQSFNFAVLVVHEIAVNTFKCLCRKTKRNEFPVNIKCFPQYAPYLNTSTELNHYIEFNWTTLRRQRGRVISVSDSQFGSPWFESRSDR